MAATTMVPVTVVPSAAGDVGGSFLAAGLTIRLSCALTAQGQDTLVLLKLGDSNYWEKTKYSLTVSRGSDFGGASGSIEVPVNAADRYLVLSTTGSAIANGVVKLNSLQPPSGLASVPGHGAAHTSIGADPIPLAVSGGASGLMSGAQALQLSELSGGAAAQTLSPAAPADGSSTALTVNNTVTLVAGNYLLDAANNSGSPVFRVTYLGGVVAPTAGPTAARQHVLPNVASDTYALLAATQTLSAKTLTAPVLAGATATGATAIDLSGATSAFTGPTGAYALVSTAGAITITAGAASTWSSTSGTIGIDGKTGINFKINAAILLDVGVTSATKVTVAANTDLNAAAGTGAMSLGAMTGASTLPTGNLGWAGASTKTASIVSTGAGSTITITAGATSTWGTSAGGLVLDAFTGTTFKVNAVAVCDVGVTAAGALTMATNKSIVGAAGSGALTLGAMTGDTTLPTGALSWTGAAAKAASLVASGAAVTITADAASTWRTTTGGLTLTSAAACTWSTAAGGLTLTSAAAATWSTAAGALTITSAAACLWSTVAGTLTLSGFAGIAAQVNGATVIDFGATTATATTIAANKNLSCAAGTTAVDLSLGTGAFKPPTGLFTFQGLVAATASAFAIADPGHAGAIPVTTSGTCNMTSAGAETRTLAAPTFVGQQVTLNSDTAVGAIVVTVATTFDSASHTTLTFATAGKAITLTCITVAGVKKWRIAGNDGVAAA